MKLLVLVLAIVFSSAIANAQTLELLPGSVHAEQLEPLPLIGPMHMQVQVYGPNHLLEHLQLIAAIGDGLSTLHAYAVLGSRMHDANPVMDSPLRFVGVKIGTQIAVTLASRKIRRNGHKRLANVVQVAGILATASFAALNERTIARAR